MAWGSIRFRVTAIAVLTSAVIVLAFGWLFIRLVTDRLVSAGQESLEAVTADVDGLSLAELGEDDAQFRLDGEEYLMLLEIDEFGDRFDVGGFEAALAKHTKSLFTGSGRSRGTGGVGLGEEVLSQPEQTFRVDEGGQIQLADV